jgi:hypothetical protein
VTVPVYPGTDVVFFFLFLFFIVVVSLSVSAQPFLHAAAEDKRVDSSEFVLKIILFVVD